MAKQLIFLVHGMGVHPVGWEADIKAGLREAYGNPLYTGLTQTFLQRYKVIPIRYDDVFEHYRNAWDSGPDEILNMIKEGIPANERAGMVNLIKSTVESLQASDSFFWTHVLDVVLYRYSLIVRSRVNQTVGLQIFRAVEQHGSSACRWSLIAHSLGTAVAHNVLNAVYNMDVPALPDVPKLRTDDTRPNLLAMIANVSRVLELMDEGTGVYDTPVRPGPVANCACRRYVNARHQFDPCVWFKPFTPDQTALPQNWPYTDLGRRNYRQPQPSVILERNVHAYRHYVDDPEVHVALFRALEGESCITDGQKAAAKVKHAEGSLQDDLAEVRAALAALQTDPQEGIRGIIKGIKGIADLLS